MKPLPNVVRIEASGENAVPYPSLTSALRMPPRHVEACIATSLDGVHLADAARCSLGEASFVSSDGTCLAWRLTLAGQDVADRTGWKVAS